MATNVADVSQPTEIERVSQDSVSLYDKVKALVVSDQGSHDLAITFYNSAKEIEKAVHSAHDPVCDHWNKMHKDATSARSRDLDKVVTAKKLAKSKAVKWEDEQERLRREEEARLQREAEEEARKQQEKLEAERKEREKQEEAERIRLAEEAEKNGASDEELNAILDAPLSEPEPEPIAVPVVAPTVAPKFEKPAGFHVRYNYSAEVVNLNDLIVAAASQPHFRQFLQVNQSAINSAARTSKDAFSLPGCKLRKERV